MQRAHGIAGAKAHPGIDAGQHAELGHRLGAWQAWSSCRHGDHLGDQLAQTTGMPMAMLTVAGMLRAHIAMRIIRY